MKIGIDARLWSQTGVGRYIRNLIVNLQETDKHNDYILFVRDSDYRDVKFRIQNSKFKIQNCDIRWHTVEEQVLLPKILNKENLDLVHFPYYSVPIFYKRNFVVTIHDLIPLHFQTGKASTLPLPFYKLKLLGFKLVVYQAAKNSKKIIAPSNATKKDILEYLKVPNSKIEVIYEGVDEGLKSKKISEKENIFLYVGNAYPHKNLDVLLNVVKKLKIPDLKLVMVGKDDYFYKRLKKKVKQMELNNKVYFHGQAAEDELVAYYRRAKALIIPSFIEGFGLPALEAMANGCLVLASDIPVLHEVGGNAAVYFDPKDGEDLKKLIEKVYSNTLVYRSKVELGFERAKEFSWKKTAEETLALYESSVNL